MASSSRFVAVGCGLASAILGVSACTAGGAGSLAPPPLGQLAAAVRLVAYDSCDQALAELKKAATPFVGPYGLGGGYGHLEEDAEAGSVAERAGPSTADAVTGASPVAPAPAHSTTNTHERGVDEPDLVKTDGRRVVSVLDGTLRVIDAQTRELAGELQMPDPTGAPWYAEQVLVAGDRALVMGYGAVHLSGPQRSSPELGIEPAGSRLILVDLSDEPRLISTLDLDGWLVDARQVGSLVRVVTRSAPRLGWTSPPGPDGEARAAQRNQDTLAESTIEDWLPRYVLDQVGQRTEGGLVACSDVSHTESYSGTAMLTVLTVDLAEGLGPADSVAIVADGQTVYGTEESLYIASSSQLVALPIDLSAGSGQAVVPPEPNTEIHKFDVEKPGKPKYVASGTVDGWLLNQYAMSEHEGYLRVATTEERFAVDPSPSGDPPSVSRVTVLAQRGDTLRPVGSVGGLGHGERIYAVRFIGPVGYVVTFRQVDPLYTLDLSDPTSPRVVGELKIPGYSAYLHPVGENRLVGVGQDADEQGVPLGLQLSLFDVDDPAAPARLDTFGLRWAWSDAESDPHAFLYWPAEELLVVPVWRGPDPAAWTPETEKLAAAGGALVLRLEGDQFTEVGFLSHPRARDQSDSPGWRHADPTIRRSLVVGETLWTLSPNGALASDLDDLDGQAWLPFTA
ncbi:MAG: beta-propeller domain-containing protein [Jiangellaceae bacterium]|nr:beta-propeller domain-containing protein [Jiangellaceae bacterium]